MTELNLKTNNKVQELIQTLKDMMIAMIIRPFYFTLSLNHTKFSNPVADIRIK